MDGRLQLGEAKLVVRFDCSVCGCDSKEGDDEIQWGKRPALVPNEPMEQVVAASQSKTATSRKQEAMYQRPKEVRGHKVGEKRM